MDYDTWLQKPYLSAADAEEKITNRVHDLMREGADCDPLNVLNMSEAISSASEDEQQSIREYCQQPMQFEKLGRLLWSISQEYWEKVAESLAQDDYGNGELDD